VFTAQYDLSPCIRQTHFVLKGLSFLDFCRNSCLHRLCVYDARHLYTHFEYSPGSSTCDVSLSTPKALTNFLFVCMKYPLTVQQLLLPPPTLLFLIAQFTGRLSWLLLAGRRDWNSEGSELSLLIR